MTEYDGDDTPTNQSFVDKYGLKMVVLEELILQHIDLVLILF